MWTAASLRRFDMRTVLMGVAGCGKSSVGVALGAALGIDYLDGDDLQQASNIAKMRRGAPLQDEDRWPWLAKVARALRDRAPVVVGCSALKRRYRDYISDESGAQPLFVHVSGSRAVIEARMRARTGHFMPTTLIGSQFAAREPPSADERAITVAIDQPMDGIVADILAQL